MNKTTTKKSKPITEGKVVHRLPGRIRVRIDRLHDDITYSNDLQQAATDLNGVTEVRVNALASSIVITYRPSELSEQHILDCLSVSLPIAQAHPLGVVVKVARKPIDRPVAEESDTPEGDFGESAEKLTAEITSEAIGESIGEIVGETVGEILMGPIGMAIGAEIGAKIGEEVADAIEHLVEESIDSTNEPKPPKPLNSPPKRNNNQKNN